MKKIISMGIASAVLALTAIAASADMVAATADKAVAGKDITVTVSTTADVESFGFVVSGTGLEVTAATATEEGTAFANVLEDGTVKVGGFNVGGYKANSVLATITFTVTGDVDTDAVVSLANGEGYDEALQNLTVKVEAEGTTDPTEPTDPTDPTDPGKEDPTDPSSPETGVALAVVPAVLAGAAVVVAKKRK